jgi:hypothetical protein
MADPNEGQDSTDDTASSDAAKAAAHYEPPAILERTSVHDALIGVITSGCA